MPLPRAVSQHARQAMRSAFEELERTITPNDAQSFSSTTLDDVVKETRAIEGQLAARSLLRNMRRLTPLFSGLEHYAKVVEVLCNGTPYLAWIWAPITLILRVASEHIEAFEQIIRGYSKIGDCLGRFKLLHTALSRDVEFQKTLSAYYMDILQFHKHAYQFVRRSGWRLLFVTSWGRFQRRFDNILEDMKRHESLVDLHANAQGVAQVLQTQQDIATWREQSKDQLDRIEKEQADQQYQSVLSWLKADDSDQLAIHDALLPIGEKYPGTCGWMLKNSKVIRWLQEKSEFPVLFLSGNPGTGKSVLVAQLLTFMTAGGKPAISHFCDPSYESSTKYDQILKSILLQLLHRDQEQLAHVYSEFVVGRKLPNHQSLKEAIRTVLTSLSHNPGQKKYIWIVIDGFNACSAEKQASLVSLINQLTSDSVSTTVCKVLVTSRTSLVLSNRLKRKQLLSLTQEKPSLEAAITTYASQRISSLHSLLRGLRMSGSDSLEIVEAVTRKADGMFLYARLLFDYIEHNLFSTCDEIKASITRLPKTISDFYRGILTQILARLDDRSVSRVRCVFNWIAFSKRPMKKTELLSAIAFSGGDPNVAHIFPRYILDTCSALVEDRGGQAIVFIHNSVKEFLESVDSPLVITRGFSYREHGIASVACLISGLENLQQPDASLRVIEGLYAFLPYAYDNWVDYIITEGRHVEASGQESDLLHLASLLAQKLEEQDSERFDHTNNSITLSQELDTPTLRSHPILQRQICLALTDKALPSLERRLQRSEEGARENQPFLSRTSLLLRSFQNIIRFLLGQRSFPGVLSEEFDAFKIENRMSAFTCSLGSCPRATAGFESAKCLRDHEMMHARLHRCEVENCQYPPFGTARGLNSHKQKYHAGKSARPIRQVSKLKSTIVPGQQVPNTAGMQGQESQVLTTIRGDVVGSGGFAVNESGQPQSEMRLPGLRALQMQKLFGEQIQRQQTIEIEQISPTQSQNSISEQQIKQREIFADNRIDTVTKQPIQFTEQGVSRIQTLENQVQMANKMMNDSSQTTANMLREKQVRLQQQEVQAKNRLMLAKQQLDEIRGDMQPSQSRSTASLPNTREITREPTKSQEALNTDAIQMLSAYGISPDSLDSQWLQSFANSPLAAKENSIETFLGGRVNAASRMLRVHGINPNSLTGRQFQNFTNMPIAAKQKPIETYHREISPYPIS